MRNLHSLLLLWHCIHQCVLGVVVLVNRAHAERIVLEYCLRDNLRCHNQALRPHLDDMRLVVQCSCLAHCNCR